MPENILIILEEMNDDILPAMGLEDMRIECRGIPGGGVELRWPCCGREIVKALPMEEDRVRAYLFQVLVTLTNI